MRLPRPGAALRRDPLAFALHASTDAAPQRTPSSDPPPRIAIVTDAWTPQVNGVVTTLRETARCLEVPGPIDFIEPGVTGVLHEDLGEAIRGALALDPAPCREAALRRSWETATRQFVTQLVTVV